MKNTDISRIITDSSSSCRYWILKNVQRFIDSHPTYWSQSLIPIFQTRGCSWGILALENKLRLKIRIMSRCIFIKDHIYEMEIISRAFLDNNNKNIPLHPLSGCSSILMGIERNYKIYKLNCHENKTHKEPSGRLTPRISKKHWMCGRIIPSPHIHLIHFI